MADLIFMNGEKRKATLAGVLPHIKKCVLKSRVYLIVDGAFTVAWARPKHSSEPVAWFPDPVLAGGRAVG